MHMKRLYGLRIHHAYLQHPPVKKGKNEKWAFLSKSGIRVDFTEYSWLSKSVDRYLTLPVIFSHEQNWGAS
jgi:hypothetical protein